MHPKLGRVMLGGGHRGRERERHDGTLLDGSAAGFANRLDAFRGRRSRASRGGGNMTDEEFENDARVVALERAVCAAENAAQTVACLWEMLSPAEQDRWLARAVTPPRAALLAPEAGTWG